jgi:S1-C subfamily serine protease
MRTILTLAILLHASFLFSDEPDKDLHEKCLHPTIIVSCYNNSGTGFIVKSEKCGEKYRNVFLTSAHIIPLPQPFYEIEIPDVEDYCNLKKYKKYNCYYTKVDDEIDVAVGVFESDAKMPTVALSFEKFHIGSKIFKVGHGFQDELRLDYGNITSPKTNHPGIENHIKYSAFTIPGDSGGPLFLNYKVIGLIRGIRTNPIQTNLVQDINHIAFAVPIENIKKLDSEYVYNPEKNVPSLPFTLLEIKNFIIK